MNTITPLKQRYDHQLDNYPLIGQSVNLIVHSLREAVVQFTEEIPMEVVVDVKDDLRSMLSSALASFDLTEEEQSDLSGVIVKNEKARF